MIFKTFLCRRLLQVLRATSLFSDKRVTVLIGAVISKEDDGTVFLRL